MSTYVLSWPPARQEWSQGPLEPYAVDCGQARCFYLLAVPLPPKTDAGNTYVLNAPTSLRPEPKVG